MPAGTQHKTRTLILVMSVLAVAALAVAALYYRGVNRSADPRVRAARELYEKYNDFAQSQQYDSVLWLMDTIESVYARTDHYRDSYEIGVLYNNRAAVYLSVYLQPGNEALIGDTALFLAKSEGFVRQSIAVYEHWLEAFAGKGEEELRTLLETEFVPGLPTDDRVGSQAYLDNRLKEILDAQEETPRRLSVSYTNLGTIKRHQLKYDSAAVYYQQAMDLWDRNLTAENNLNILLNRPLKKRNLIQTLFPPDR
ncbi:MAG: hypothetical protein R2751_11330 [Bacteroidales bacterium]